MEGKENDADETRMFCGDPGSSSSPLWSYSLDKYSYCSTALSEVAVHGQEVAQLNWVHFPHRDNLVFVIDAGTARTTSGTLLKIIWGSQSLETLNLTTLSSKTISGSQPAFMVLGEAPCLAIRYLFENEGTQLIRRFQIRFYTPELYDSAKAMLEKLNCYVKPALSRAVTAIPKASLSAAYSPTYLPPTQQGIVQSLGIQHSDLAQTESVPVQPVHHAGELPQLDHGNVHAKLRAVMPPGTQDISSYTYVPSPLPPLRQLPDFLRANLPKFINEPAKEVPTKDIKATYLPLPKPTPKRKGPVKSMDNDKPDKPPPKKRNTRARAKITSKPGSKVAPLPLSSSASKQTILVQPSHTDAAQPLLAQNWQSTGGCGVHSHERLQQPFFSATLTCQPQQRECYIYPNDSIRGIDNNGTQLGTTEHSHSNIRPVIPQVPESPIMRPSPHRQVNTAAMHMQSSQNANTLNKRMIGSYETVLEDPVDGIGPNTGILSSGKGNLSANTHDAREPQTRDKQGICELEEQKSRAFENLLIEKIFDERFVTLYEHVAAFWQRIAFERGLPVLPNFPRGNSSNENGPKGLESWLGIEKQHSNR